MLLCVTGKVADAVEKARTRTSPPAETLETGDNLMSKYDEELIGEITALKAILNDVIALQMTTHPNPVALREQYRERIVSKLDNADISIPPFSSESIREYAIVNANQFFDGIEVI